MSVINDISDLLNIPTDESEKILTKAISGSEITDSFNEKDWFEQRFKPNVVFIDETGYTKMCVDALKILGTTAATDYGSSRQRDLGQLWADMTRGYLGEYAFQSVKEPSGKYRTPNLSISYFNGEKPASITGLETITSLCIWHGIDNNYF